MEIKQITCVICPKGCSIKAYIDKGNISELEGYGCKRGIEYARAECINPVRTLTTIVRVEGCCCSMAPVKSDRPMPKTMLVEAVKQINKYTANAPVKIGDIIVANILGTGVNIIATSNISEQH